jgi:hypothetical protein
MRYRFSAMMLFFLMTFMLPRAVAQQPQPGAPAGSTTLPSLPESKVAPDAAVITIHGLCGNVFLPGSAVANSSSAAPSAAADAAAGSESPNPNCETIITRQQFETLIRGISPVDPQFARGFARDYPETLMFARKAIEVGLDKDPGVQALLQYRYQQALYSIFKATLTRKAKNLSDAELEKFYNDNRARYEVFGLLRIHVPNQKTHTPAPGSSTPPKIDVAADEAAMKSVAEKIRAEAVAGGDFETLQAKAYRLAGETEEPPDPDLGDKWTRDNFPADSQSAVFGLKPGQVSQPIHNANGWHIIKVVSRKTVPLSEAADMTRGMVVGDQANSLRKALKTELNDQYFVSPVANEAKAPLE